MHKTKKHAFIVLVSYMAIKTERLYLGNLSIKDIWHLYYYRALPMVSQYQSWQSYSYQDAYDLVMRMKDKDFQGFSGTYQWGIYLDEHIIGDIFFELALNGVCWLGYTLDPNYWHQGYAYEAMYAFINYLHKNFGISTFMAYILKENLASIHLIHKLGFHELHPQVYIKNSW